MGGTVKIGGEIEGDVAIFGGNLDIVGNVNGDAAVLGGNINHEGTIEGDLFVIGGKVTLDSGSVVEGDINLVGGDVDRDENATVGGEVKAVELNKIRKYMPRIGISEALKFTHKLPRPRIIAGTISLSLMIVIYILNLLALLIFPRAIEQIIGRIHDELWVSVAIGFGLEIMFAPIIVLFAISIVGILLIPVFGLAIVIAAIFGFTAISEIIGERIAKGLNWPTNNRIGLLTVGWITTMLILILGTIFSAISLPGISILLIVLGWIIIYVAATIGLGATVYAMFKTVKK